MVSRSTPRASTSMVPHRWLAAPMPALASDTLSLLALTYSTSSLMLLGGKSSRAMTVMGTSTTRPTGSKLLKGTWPGFLYSDGAIGREAWRERVGQEGWISEVAG